MTGIVVGACVKSHARFASLAGGGLSTCLPEANIIALENQSSIFDAYNTILDKASGSGRIVLLIHEDTVVRDLDLRNKLVDAFESDPRIAVIGVVGARGPASLAWHGVADCRGRVEETRYTIDWGGGNHEVDVIDGLLIALSPWAVENLRFDSGTYGGFHGYDADICLQARSAGRLVMTIDLDVFHATKGGYGDRVGFLRTDLLWRRKWKASGFLSETTRTWDIGRWRSKAVLWAMPVVVRTEPLFAKLRWRVRWIRHMAGSSA